MTAISRFFDGTVGIRDIDLEVLAVGESNSLRNGLNRHYRMLAEREFDACEVSLSSYIMAKGQGLPFTATPVFPRRLFSQSHIWVNADGSIRAPKDLIGRKVGLITFQTTLSWDSVFLLEITFRLNGTMFNIRPNFFPFEIFLGVRPSGRVNLMGSSDATHHSISRHRGLLRAKDSISFELAERRSIRLISPYSPSKSTSRTLQFSFSIVNPGEVARAHRHNMAAIRFVVQGHGACTVVEGERFLMEEGDLILTPNWTWHDHFNASGEPIIWLDGLGGPLIYTLNALFFEEYEKEAQTVVRADGDSTRHLGLAPRITAIKFRARRDAVSLPVGRYLCGFTSHQWLRSRPLRRLSCSIRQSTIRWAYAGDDVLCDATAQTRAKDPVSSSHKFNLVPRISRTRPDGGG